MVNPHLLLPHAISRIVSDYYGGKCGHLSGEARVEALGEAVVLGCGAGELSEKNSGHAKFAGEAMCIACCTRQYCIVSD